MWMGPTSGITVPEQTGCETWYWGTTLPWRAYARAPFCLGRGHVLVTATPRCPRLVRPQALCSQTVLPSRSCAGADEQGVVIAAFGSLLSAKPQAMLAVAHALAGLQRTVVWKVVPADIENALQADFDEVVRGETVPVKDCFLLSNAPSGDQNC